MPRRSAASLATPSDQRVTRLKPPASLSKPERAAFVDLVSSCDPKHFAQSDMPLVIRYVEAIAQADQAALRIRTDGAVINGKPSPWVMIQEKAVRSLVMLALRLRLSPQARQPNRLRQPDKRSYYEVQDYDERD
jgi:phage terminase small subunit